MDDLERKIFITYVSEHLLHFENHYHEMVDLLMKWEQRSPIPSRLEYTLKEIMN
jgi:hypothetical protein